MHLAVVACGNRLEETLVMLKSAVLFSHRKMHFHIFTEESLKPEFDKQVNSQKAQHNTCGVSGRILGKAYLVHRCILLHIQLCDPAPLTLRRTVIICNTGCQPTGTRLSTAPTMPGLVPSRTLPTTLTVENLSQVPLYPLLNSFSEAGQAEKP